MTETRSFTIAPATTAADLAAIRELFMEYVASLGFDLGFQDVTAELADLPGKYAAPRGGLFLAYRGPGPAVGCVGFRPLAVPGECEMKRLYLRPGARGLDLGRHLALTAIAQAKGAGYRRIRLDTLATMHAAQALYSALGFRETEAYYDSPIPGTRYMALEL
jgi:ribosomal protein S18 acetylase RimI-like enzyme